MSIQNPTILARPWTGDNHKRSHVPRSILEIDDTDSTVVHVSGWYHSVFWVGVFLFSWGCIWVVFFLVSNCSFCCLPAMPDFPSLVDSLVSDDRIAMTIRPHSAVSHYNLLIGTLQCIYSAPRVLLEYVNCKLQCTQGIRVQYSNCNLQCIQGIRVQYRSCKLQCILGYPPMCGPGGGVVGSLFFSLLLPIECKIAPKGAF